MPEDTPMIKVGAPLDDALNKRPTRAGRNAKKSSSQNPTASEEVENFKPVPVVGRLAWRTQYRLFAILLLVGLLAFSWSAYSFFGAAASDRARHQAQVSAVHALLGVDQAMSLALTNVPVAKENLDTSLRNASSAISTWSSNDPAWMERWSKVETQVKPWREALGSVSPTDGRMLSAALNTRQSIAELGHAIGTTSVSSVGLSGARTYLVISIIWVVGALLFLLWIHWKQQRLHALTAQSDSERMQSSIMNLMEHMRVISEGDLTRKAPVSEDAVGTLADILNSTVDGLRELARSVKVTSERTADGVRLASDTTGLLVDRAREDLATQGANGAEILRLAQGVRRLAQLARSVHKESSSVSTSVQDGSAAVFSARTRIEDIRKLNEEAGNRIGRLALSSREISSIATMLHSLADQAGVLADQASLQASRAGDAGRGFGIVALGMAELARQTDHNARKVGTLIETALSDIEAARISMSNAVSGTDEASRLIDVSNDAGRDAVERVDELGTVVDELANLVSEQDSIAVILDSNTKVALERIEDGHLRAQQAAEGVLSLMGTVRELSESANRFKV